MLLADKHVVLAWKTGGERRLAHLQGKQGCTCEWGEWWAHISSSGKQSDRELPSDEAIQKYLQFGKTRLMKYLLLWNATLKYFLLAWQAFLFVRLLTWQPLSGSQHMSSSGRKTLQGLLHAPFCRAQSQYMNLYKYRYIYTVYIYHRICTKMEVKPTWRQLGLTACHMLQGGKFASHDCEKSCKNLTGNQDFRIVVKSVLIQIVERAKFEKECLGSCWYNVTGWLWTSRFEKSRVKVEKFSIELGPSNVRDCPACTTFRLNSLHLNPVSTTSVVFYHWIIKILIWIQCEWLTVSYAFSSNREILVLIQK